MTTPDSRACCLGDMEVPSDYQQFFVDGSQKAIDIIYSQAFEDNLSQYIASLPNSYKVTGPWRGVDAKQVVQLMRKRICGLNIDTYGGLIALANYKINGNLAYDGEGSKAESPILFNRWALVKYDANDIANTIAHEVAHRVDLTHPSSKNKRTFSAALCEPPYVIGNIVESLARGQKWDPYSVPCYKEIITHP